MENKTNITGHTLIEMGFKSGKWFKEALNYINENQLNGDALNTRANAFKNFEKRG